MSGPELDASVYEDLDAELDREAATEYLDWDAFWSAQAAQVTPALIRGVKVTPPLDLPLATVRRVTEVMGSTDETEHREVLALMFGADVFGTWETNGMGIREMQVVLVWAGSHMQGQPVTFQEALETYTRLTAERESGKAPAPGPNRDARRRSSRRR